jgi:DNA-binding CsgD family transcriptional regulator
LTEDEKGKTLENPPGGSGMKHREKEKKAIYFHTMQGKLFLYMLIATLSIVAVVAALLVFHILTVQPEIQENRDLFLYLLADILFVLLLVGIAVFLSYLMSRRFAKPLLQSISDYQAGHKSKSSIQEIDGLLTFFDQKDFARNRELSRLAYDRKNEVDPYQYELFLTGLDSLTPTEREIFDLYVQGKETKEITRIKGIRESTLRYHNRNIYSKLSVRSLKQMLRLSAVMKEEEIESADPPENLQ